MKRLELHSTLLLMWVLASATVLAQSSLSIEECYLSARENYPMIKQRELISLTKEYSVEKIARGNLPQVVVFGQASYQSAVTSLPFHNIGNIEVPVISKDQYRIYAEASQNLYDGGMMKQQKRLEGTGAKIEAQKLEVELYKLNDKINQIYFGILLLDQQLKQNLLFHKDVDLALQKMKGAIANGTSLSVTGDALQAEILKSDQKQTELQAARKAYLEMLSLFINRQLPENTRLTVPVLAEVHENITRPELALYDNQAQQFGVQEKLISAKNRPRFNLFFQGGYARPGLNLLSNSFSPYYIGGLRLNWSLGGLYTLRKEKALVNLNRQGVMLQKETFLFNTNLTLKQQQQEREKYATLLQTDNEIIRLRSNVKRSAVAQLENGVITSTDYLREVNAEDQARQNKFIHEIQLLLAGYSQQTTTGL